MKVILFVSSLLITTLCAMENEGPRLDMTIVNKTDKNYVITSSQKFDFEPPYGLVVNSNNPNPIETGIKARQTKNFSTVLNRETRKKFTKELYIIDPEMERGALQIQIIEILETDKLGLLVQLITRENEQLKLVTQDHITLVPEHETHYAMRISLQGSLLEQSKIDISVVRLSH